MLRSSLVKDGTGRAHLEPLSQSSPHLCLLMAGDAGLYLRLEWAHAAETLVVSKHWEENPSNTLNEITLFTPLSTPCAPALLASALAAVAGHRGHGCLAHSSQPLSFRIVLRMLELLGLTGWVPSLDATAIPSRL